MDTTRWGDGFPEQEPGVPQSPEAGVPQGYPPGYRMEEDPFEEPENAPELRQQRSDSLYSRTAPFWDRVIEEPAEGEEYPKDPEYWNHPEVIRDVVMRVADRPGDKLRRFLGSGTVRYTIAALAVLAVVGFLLFSVFTTVRSITVEGETSFTDEQIIALSQLKLGMSTFGLDEKAVMERINRERYLRCTLVDISLDKVVLHVRQRVPATNIVQNGRLIILDERGWVLEIDPHTMTPRADLIEVKGLDVQHCSLGQEITLRMPARLPVYTRLLVELRAMGGLHMISELDMTSMDSITLKTRDGFTVEMGNEARLHEKLRAMMVLRETVLENRYYGDRPGGTIVVIDPESPAYRLPAATWETGEG